MYILTQVQIPMQVAPHGVYVAYDPYAYACASVYAHAYAYAFALPTIIQVLGLLISLRYTYTNPNANSAAHSNAYAYGANGSTSTMGTIDTIGIVIGMGRSMGRKDYWVRSMGETDCCGDCRCDCGWYCVSAHAITSEPLVKGASQANKHRQRHHKHRKHHRHHRNHRRKNRVGMG